MSPDELSSNPPQLNMAVFLTVFPRNKRVERNLKRKNQQECILESDLSTLLYH